MQIFKKKDKEVYIEKTGLLGNATDYAVLHPSIVTKAMWFIVGMIVVGAVAFVFYESVFLAIVVGVVGGLIFIPIRKKSIIAKRKKNLTLQFKEMLESMSTSLSSGKNIFDSITESRKDLAVQFPPDADIISEVDIIIQGINNNLKVENLIADFAERCELNDVKDFASVFSTCYNKGGNINEVIKNTVSIINDKMNIEMEIETVVTAQKSDQYVMLIMPVVFIVALKAMGGGLINLSSVVGKLSMTAAIIIFIIAYLIGKKILDIKV